MIAKLDRSAMEVPTINSAILPSFIDFGRETCCSLDAARDREWLVTNGIGGFASGTIAALTTRRYHGLLVAALKPPLGRTLLVAKLEETAQYDGGEYALFADRWADGTVNPRGYNHLERFRLEGNTPIWTFAFADARLEKRIWMQNGANTTLVQYSLMSASRPLHLDLKALVNYRDYHTTTHGGDWRMTVEQVEHGLRIVAFEGATPFYLLSASASGEPAHVWYRNFDLAAEHERGLDYREDHLHAGTFRTSLQGGDSVTIVCTVEPHAELNGTVAYERRLARQQDLLSQWTTPHPELAKQAPPWVPQLVLAADQFIVKRPLTDEPDACSVIAGYHWFGDWGRDTMIALPGLMLATGRPQLARSVLRTLGRFVDCGMLPNVFPDTGETPEYNTVDATLWYFEALRQYYAATADSELLRELFPVLSDIIEWHQRGTRYGIRVDPNDGLLHAGEPGVQLTWMDAKVGDWVVTPRIGKPIEVNALWLNALVTMAQFARTLGLRTETYEFLARCARDGFRRFWNESANYCFDVIDGPEPCDSSLRPNQILAVSLPECALNAEQQRAVVDVCARHLLTSYGLRSLAPGHANYQGRYRGGPRERDCAYHQGTVWGWLLGPFVLAHLRVYGDPIRAAAFLEPIANHLRAAGIGSASEIFDGDAPFTPRGCIAQAWTVAELLRAWTATAVAEATARKDTHTRSGGATRKSPAGQEHKDQRRASTNVTNGRGAEFECSRLGVSESKRKSRCGTYRIERTKMKKLLWAATAVLLFATVSRAQGTPAAEFAMGYSHFQIIKGLTIAMDGGSGSAAFNGSDWFGIVGDLGVYRNEPCCVDLTAMTYTFGPRFSYRKLGRVVPFAQALVGGSNFSTSFNGVSGSQGNHFAYSIGGGFDVVLGRSGKVALRPQADYFGIRVNGSVISNARLALGIVFRLGKK